MLHFSVGIYIVVFAHTPAVSRTDILQGIHRTAPVFWPQRIDRISVLIFKTAFFDLHKQIIEIILCPDIIHINPKGIHNRLLDIHAAPVILLRIICQGLVCGIHIHLPQIYAVQVIPECDVFIGIPGKIAFLIISGIHL